MTDWTPQDDWSQVKVGDTVRATRNDDAITYEVVDKYIAITGDAPYALVVRPVGLTWQTRLDRNVWSLSVPTKPAVELPTEPGIYLTSNETVVELDPDGRWFDRVDNLMSHKWVSDAAPFIRLEPIAVTAKKVIGIVRDRIQVSGVGQSDGPTTRGFLRAGLQELAEEFGVTE